MTDEDDCEHILGNLVMWVIEMLVLDQKECPELILRGYQLLQLALPSDDGGLSLCVSEISSSQEAPDQGATETWLYLFQSLAFEMTQL